VIRGAVVHMVGEQPFLVDLETMPSASDVALVCTNMRNTSGKRPSFIDAIDSTFVIPYTQIRFVEIPLEALGDQALGLSTAYELDVEEEPELELDEDLLRRVREA
jgi:hypothetical protein